MTAPSRETLRAYLWVESLELRTTPTASTPDRVLVTFADPSTDHLAELSRLPLAASVSRITTGVYRVDLSAGTAIGIAVADLGRLPGVTAAERDNLITTEQTASDPGASGQWGLSKIGAPAAWDQSIGTGAIVVAVIDTGVDYTHPDLAANMWHNPREIPGNGRDDDGDGIVDDVYGVNFQNSTGNPMDDAGHGTHVAGIIGARGGNGIGVTGVAWQTQIMALKFMNASGGYTSDAIRAVDYAIAHGAKVINASWGGGSADPALQAAFNRARAAGVIVVVAAGNNSTNIDASPFYPASYSRLSNNVVAVAATDRSDNLAGFSNYGAGTVTVAAPGVGIQSTLPGGRYGSMSGTSMATPFVTGAVAIFWGVHPGWSYQMVIARLREAADVVPGVAGKVAAGRLDVAGMFEVSPPTPPPPAPITDTTAPRIVSSTLSGLRVGVFDRVRVRFSEAINPATFTTADATGFGPFGVFGISAVLPVAGTNNTEFMLMFSRSQTVAGGYTVAIGPDIRDGAGHPMDQNGNGIAGEAGDRFSTSATLSMPAVPPIAPPATGTASRTYSAPSLPRPIQDRRTTRIDIVVTDQFRIADLNVQLTIAHARTRDLNIRLVAPDGRSVTLFNRRGSGANLSGTIFDDSATLPVGSAGSAFAGSFRPEQALALFNGMNVRGVWSIQIFDLADGVGGAVQSARLDFTPQTSALTMQAATTDYPTLSAADLRGADEFARSAVLNGRDDVTTRTPGLTTAAPVRIGWNWFGEQTGTGTANFNLSIPLAHREGLPLTAVVTEPPADLWADLDDYGPIPV